MQRQREILRQPSRRGRLGLATAAVVAALSVALASVAGPDWTTRRAAAEAAEPVVWPVNIVEPEQDYTTWGFDPSTVTVSAGDTVHWVNQGRIDHSIFVKDPNFSSDILHTGDSVDYTFTSAGTYAYVCGLHPTMQGTVIVQ